MDGYGPQPPIYHFNVIDPELDHTYLPERGDPHATGWDVRASRTIKLYPTKLVKIPLGIRCIAPEGYWLELRPRSSTFSKKNLHALYGVIDCSYEGELLFACQWIPEFRSHANYHSEFLGEIGDYLRNEMTIEKGDRIGQLVPVRRQEMIAREVSSEEFERMCKERGFKRGAGGFGSTGK